MTICIKEIIPVLGIAIVLAIAIWRFHSNTHGKINDKLDKLSDNFAELNAKIAWIEGRHYQYIADQRERQEQDASYRQEQHSLERIGLQQNKKEE